MVASPVVQTQGLHHITINGADKKPLSNFGRAFLGCRSFLNNQIWIILMKTTCILIRATAFNYNTNEKRFPDKSKVGTELDQFITSRSMLVVRVSPRLLSVWRIKR